MIQVKETWEPPHFYDGDPPSDAVHVISEYCPKCDNEARLLAERLYDVIVENCPKDASGNYDSQDKPSFADAMNAIEKYGYIEIIRDSYGRVVAKDKK